MERASVRGNAFEIRKTIEVRGSHVLTFLAVSCFEFSAIARQTTMQSIRRKNRDAFKENSSGLHDFTQNFVESTFFFIPSLQICKLDGVSQTSSNS